MKFKNLLMTSIAIFGLTNIVFGQTLPSYVPSNGIIGWWPFNGNANDESGNGNNGTVNGAALTEDRFGNINSSYGFAGGNERIIINNPLLPSTPSSFSISLWVLSNASSTGDLICDRSTSTFYYKYRFILRNDLPNSPITFNTVNGNLVSGVIGGTFSDPIWAQVVAVADISSNTTSLFFNGQFVDTDTLFYPNHQNATTIGANFSPTGPNSGINGKIDDIGIWNRALTQEEITSLYYGSSLVLNEEPQSNLFSVYPNPAQNVINVNTDAKLVGSVFTIYDNIGKVVKSGKLNSANTTIELNDLSGGIYTFNLGENRKQTFKVIKE